MPQRICLYYVSKIIYVKPYLSNKLDVLFVELGNLTTMEFKAIEY